MSRVVTFGEIMLRLAPQGFLRFSQANSFDAIYGGGESNVAVSLANYGIDVDFVTRLPKNDIYDRAHSAIAEIESGMINWEEVFDGAEWFHWTGITPAISQGAADVCLEAVKAASKLGVKISTDLNYRAKLWTYCDNAHREAVMTELTSYCDVVLGNEEDAEMHFGIKPEGISVQTEGQFINLPR